MTLPKNGYFPLMQCGKIDIFTQKCHYYLVIPKKYITFALEND